MLVVFIVSIVFIYLHLSKLFVNLLKMFVKKKKKKKKSGIAMLPEDTNLLQFNQYRKSDHTQSIIYVDLDSSIKRIDGFKYGAEKISTAKVGKHISGGYSIKH